MIDVSNVIAANEPASDCQSDGSPRSSEHQAPSVAPVVAAQGAGGVGAAPLSPAPNALALEKNSAKTDFPLISELAFSDRLGLHRNTVARHRKLRLKHGEDWVGGERGEGEWRPSPVMLTESGVKKLGEIFGAWKAGVAETAAKVVVVTGQDEAEELEVVRCDWPNKTVVGAKVKATGEMVTLRVNPHSHGKYCKGLVVKGRKVVGVDGVYEVVRNPRYRGKM